MNPTLEQGNKIFFEVEKDSNYRVRMTYGEEEIISFEQFQKLSNAIFNGQGDFITINKRIVQKKDIRMIEPTQEKTKKEKELREQQLDDITRIETEKNKWIKVKDKFSTNFFNEKFGKDKWSHFPNRRGFTHVTPDVWKACWEAFIVKYPEADKILTSNLS